VLHLTRLFEGSIVGTFQIPESVNGVHNVTRDLKGGSTLVTLPRILTPYRDSVDGTHDRVTYQKLVTR